MQPLSDLSIPILASIHESRLREDLDFADCHQQLSSFRGRNFLVVDVLAVGFQFVEIGDVGASKFKLQVLQFLNPLFVRTGAIDKTVAQS